MQIVRFVKTLVIGGIFFSMMLSIAAVNEKTQVMQNSTIQTSNYSILDLNEKDSQDMVLQNQTKVVACIVFEKQGQEFADPVINEDEVQKPKSYISFSIFNPPKFS